jgi:polysaccharide deacetylase 2 family uncharacterized protein YibQ
MRERAESPANGGRMGRGIFTGFVAGGMVSVLALSVASLMAPLPPSVQVAGLPQAPLAPDAPPNRLPEALPPVVSDGIGAPGAPVVADSTGPEMTAPAADSAPSTPGEQMASPAEPADPSGDSVTPPEPQPATTPTAPPEATAPKGEPAPADTIDIPAGSEFARRPEDAPVRPPQVMAAPAVTAPPAGAPEAPASGSETSPVLTETAPAARPESQAAAPEPKVMAGSQPGPALIAPGAEEPIPVPPPGEVETPALAPVENPRLPGPAPVQMPAPALPRVLPPPGSVASGEIQFQPAPEAGSAPAAEIPQPGFANAPGVAVNRLPSITPPAGGEAAALAEPFEALPRTPEEMSGPRRALQIFAADASLPEGVPVMSVILVDPGAGAGGVSTEALSRIGLPVTIALDPTRADAPAAADAYRAAGLEVSILAAALPAGAKPSDVEVALQDWHRLLPEAVALVEPAAPQIQNNRVLAQQLVKALAADGLGLVTQDRGLNAAYQLAPSEGLAQARIWRVLDAGRESAPVIERTLERAAFEAERDGSVVVMLTAWPDTIEALQQFALSKGQTLALAPVSAVALRSPVN